MSLWETVKTGKRGGRREGRRGREGRKEEEGGKEEERKERLPCFQSPRREVLQG